MNILKDEETQNYIKATIPYDKFDNINNDIIAFYMKFNQLKNLYRQGWLKVRMGLEHKEKCESVADHSFSMALLTLSIIQKYDLKYDLLKCLKMCIIHELGEIYVGDYTPFDNISKEQKHKEERQAVKKILSELDFDNDFLDLWKEFEKRETKEAKFIKNIDQLEFLLQAAAYEFDTSYFKRSLNALDNEYCIEIAKDLLDMTDGKNEPKIAD